MNSVKLTKYSHGGGCGCKIAPAVLEKILGNQRHQTQFPLLIAGNEGNEDAAAWQISDQQSLVSTTDFFMPIVDSPQDFGAIAATNALSDVYAMGASPLFALAILGWPIEKLDVSIAADVMDGARQICNEAGIPIAGGHSIDNPEPIFGLVVNGLVNTQHIKRNNTAKPGDLIFLSKALGTGMVTTAAKRGLARNGDLEAAVAQMRKLNKEGIELATLKGVHALTDVSGFGLAGHLVEMAKGSGLHAEIQFSALPQLSGTEHYISQMIYPDMTMKNFNAFKDLFDEMDMATLLLLCDPQTSGGLLIAVDPTSGEAVKEILHRYGSYAEPIGVFTETGERTISLLP